MVVFHIISRQKNNSKCYLMRWNDLIPT